MNDLRTGGRPSRRPAGVASGDVVSGFMVLWLVKARSEPGAPPPAGHDRYECRRPVLTATPAASLQRSSQPPATPTSPR